MNDHSGKEDSNPLTILPDEPVANVAMEYCELLQEHGGEAPGRTIDDYLSVLDPALHDEFLELVNLEVLAQAAEGLVPLVSHPKRAGETAALDS